MKIYKEGNKIIVDGEWATLIHGPNSGHVDIQGFASDELLVTHFVMQYSENENEYAPIYGEPIATNSIKGNCVFGEGGQP